MLIGVLFKVQKRPFHPFKRHPDCKKKDYGDILWIGRVDCVLSSNFRIYLREHELATIVKTEGVCFHLRSTLVTFSVGTDKAASTVMCSLSD